jgi:hypothetical protein
MKKKLIFISIVFSLFSFSASALTAEQQTTTEQDTAEPVDRVELKTSFIKGNKELPQVLYIVPWQEIKKATLKPENMVLHSLYGDIFQPVTTKSLQD